ncbi:MAG: carboxyl transferase domain-containing protein [Eubacteriales bacterium]
MENNSKEMNKSMRRAVTAEKLTEMLREIDISAAVDDSGAYSAVARLTALFDHGTFSRMGAYINRSSYPDEPAGVICGYGAVGGRLVYAFAQDSSRMDGAFDAGMGKLICDLYDAALHNGAPVVGIFDSNGACIYEGARMLSALGRTFKANSAASGVVPRIAIVPGTCTGSHAVLASSFDFLISLSGEKQKSEIYAVSPFLNGVQFDPASEGISCFAAADEAELYRYARKLISFIPSNCKEGTAIDPEVSEYELSRSADLKGLCGEELIGEISDRKNYIRLFADYSPEIAAGFASVGGVACAFIASDRTHKDGALTPSACKVIARLQSFADSYAMPLLAFVDCPGLDDSVTDNAKYLDALASVADAFCFSTNPKISVVIGRAYGPGFVYMCSKSCGADISFALTDACISALSPESSVALVWNDRIKENDLVSSREMLELEWREKLSSPNDAALCGEIDDILTPSELRPRVVSALHMLLGKTSFEASRKKR